MFELLLLLGQTELPAVAVGALVNAAKTGGALAISVLVLQIFVVLGKKLSTINPMIKQYGKIVILIASAVLTVLAAMLGGLVWVEALFVFMGTAGTSFIHDLIDEIVVLRKGTNTDA